MPAESPAPADGQPLSKKAQKRLAKAAYIAERKKERRAAEKERKKEKKRALAEKRAAGELDEEEAARDRKRQKKEQGPRTPFNARIVVDLGFDDKMTENVSGKSGWFAHRVFLWRRTAGGEVSDVAVGVYVQREPEGCPSVLFAAVHVAEWTDVGAHGRDEQRRIQAVGQRGMVGGRLH